jgi:hypothetical protein
MESTREPRSQGDAAARVCERATRSWALRRGFCKGLPVRSASYGLLGLLLGGVTREWFVASRSSFRE